MLSRISKMGVFGIVALMLAFGLTAGDVLAVKTEVTVLHNRGTGVRAAAEVVIQFTVKLGTTQSTTEVDDIPGTVTITIPSVWSRPINADGAADTVGEVFVGGEKGDYTGTVSGRNLVVSAGKDVLSEQMTFTFKTVAPARMGVYTFPVSAPAYTGAEDLKIAVGPVGAGAGSGTVALSRTSPGTALNPQPIIEDADDKDPPYEGKYVLTSEESLANLVVKFTAKGTMPTGSVVKLESKGFAEFTRTDAAEVAVSGHVDVVRAKDSVTATVKDPGIQKGALIVFTIKSYKAPIVTNAAIDKGETTIELKSLVPETVVTVTDKTTDKAAVTVKFQAEPIGLVQTAYNFITTKPHGTGKVVLRAGGDKLGYPAAAAESAVPGKQLIFDITETAGIGQGAMFEIMIPKPWPQPFVPINLTGTTQADGAVTTAVTVDGRTLKGALPAGGVKDITYWVEKVPVAGSYTFPSKASAGHHGAPAPIASPTLEVTVGAGKGSVALSRGGRAFTQTSSEADLGNLTFTFTAGGRMVSGAKVTIEVATGWTAFREDNGDGVADPGEVTLSGKANLVVTPASLITATLSGTMKAGETLVFTYKNVKAPKVDGSASHTFQAQASSNGVEAVGDIGDPSVGIGRAPDGGGTLALSTTQADAGSTIGDLTITFTAAGKMESGSTVKVAIPENGDWPAPNETGRVELSAGTPSTTATTMSVTTDSVLDEGNTIIFTYKNLTAPATGGTYTFTAESTSAPIGTLTALSSGVTIIVDEVAAGSISLAGADGMLTSADPGMALSNLTFTFAAGAQMARGAQVQITVPVGWTPVFADNNDGADAPGEVLVVDGDADLSVSGGGGTPWNLNLTTNAVLEVGNTLTVTYKMVTAPSAEATYFFTTKASLAAGGLLPINNPPRVIVRKTVTTVAINADPDSVFVGEEVKLDISLWAGDEGTNLGSALGNVVVTLISSSDTSVFPASVTIPDKANAAVVTFSDPTAGSVTVTATAGDLTATVVVEVKSTIRDVAADMTLVKQGSPIMVSATGKAGGGTVTVLDSDGKKVGTKKALDPIGEPDADGDQEYSRSITLPATLADGMYTISVEIQGDTDNSLKVEVLKDQTKPALSVASVLPATVKNGDLLTLSVKASSGNEVASVMANISEVDSTQTDMVKLTKQPGTADTYFAVHTISDDNAAKDGEQMVTFTATDKIGGKDTATASVTLKNDVTAPELSDESADPPLATNGMEVTISVSSESGLTVIADASAIGGGDDEALTEGMMAADGNGMDANGNGNGDNGMTDTAMPAGNGVYTGMVTVTDAEAGEQTITITATDISGNDSTVDVTVTIEVMEPIAPVTAIAVVADPTSVFAGEDINVTVTLWRGAEEGAASADMVINLSDGEAGGSFSDADGNATTSITIGDAEHSASATYSNDSAGDVTLTATVADEESELEPATVEVTVKAFISNFQVNDTDEPGALMAGVTITVSATGKEGKATVTVTDADGEGVVPSKGLTGLDEEPDEEGNVDYTREFDLPVVLADGIYTVTVSIAGETAAMTIEIINDQSVPALSNQKVLPDTVASGSVITLSIDVSSNVPNPELSVMADVSEIDADQAAVKLTKLPGTESTYANIYVVKNSDPQDDGEKTITFMATDRIGGASEMTVSTSLKNDVTAPELSDPTAMPSPVENGMDVTISVSSESGLTVTADASAIGGGTAEVLTEGKMAADGNGVYTGMVTVTDAEAGEQTITIKAVDASGNETTIDVAVTVEVHEVTSVTFVRTGDTITVTTMGTAGLTATFSVSDAEGMNIVNAKGMRESDDGGSYTGSFIIVVDAHPAGEYWISTSVGTASMTAEGALTIDHGAHFTLSIGAGIHAIHIPLDVTEINGEDGTIETVGDVYDALGDSVRFIITLGADGNWMSYLGDESAGTAADAAIGDDTGLIAVMESAGSIELVGDALGTGGVSMVNINVGNNLVGVPLDPAVDMTISDALVEGVGAIAVSNASGDGFHTITAAGDSGDGPVMGGVGYIVVYTGAEATSIPIVGSAWENSGAVMAAPAVAFSGSQTPVLHVDGSVMDEFDMLSRIPELRVTVRNLSTGASLDTVLGTEASTTAYSATFVEFGRHAAKAGDVLEIVAHSPNPYVGVRPVPQIVVSAEEVLTSRISLPDMELYEIPSESELLANYPNPFNPETWIPYRLANAAEVTLDIYDTNGRLVRTIDIGFKPAAVYESRASAIYWDGRNNYGERVASGTYFYHLTVGDDYASTRRMVILK